MKKLKRFLLLSCCLLLAGTSFAQWQDAGTIWSPQYRNQIAAYDSTGKLSQLGSQSSAFGTFAPSYTRRVTLTAAQIKAMHTTPDTLLGLPGENKVYQVLGVSSRLNYTSPVYGTDSVLIVYIPNTFTAPGNSIIAENTSPLTRAGTNVSTFQAFQNPVFTTPNAPVLISTLTANPTSGNSTLDVFITYSIITLPAAP